MPSSSPQDIYEAARKIFKRDNRSGDCIELLEQALKIRPNHTNSILLYIEYIRENQGEIPALKRSWIEICKHKNDKKLYLQRADILEQVYGGIFSAQWCKAAQEMFPSDATILYRYAKALFRDDYNLKASLAWVGRALEIKPAQIDALRLKVAILVKLGSLPAALACCTEGLNAHPKETILRLRKGEIKDQLFGSKRAAKWYAELVKEFPDEIRFRYELCKYQIKSGWLNSASQTLRGVPEKNKEDYQFLNMRSEIAHLNADDKLASSNIQIALSRARREGNARQELLFLVKASQISPKSASAVRILELLRSGCELRDTHAVTIFHFLEQWSNSNAPAEFLEILIKNGHLKISLAKVLFLRWVRHLPDHEVDAQLAKFCCICTKELATKIVQSPDFSNLPSKLKIKKLRNGKKLTLTTYNEVIAVAAIIDALGKVELSLRLLRRGLRRWPSIPSMMFAYTRSLARYGRLQEVLDELKFYDQNKVIAHDRYAEIKAHLQFQLGNRLPLIKLTAKKINTRPGNIDRNDERLMLLNLPQGDLHGRAISRIINASTNKSNISMHRAPTINGGLANEISIYKKHSLPSSAITAHAVAIVDRHVEQLDAPKATKRYVSKIPKHIMQYWSNGRPGLEVAEIMSSWKYLPGYKYELFDKRSAADYIAGVAGVSWVRAFKMCRSAAEESDFFRLLWLIHNGGIYADSDDRVILTPDPLLAAANHTLLYQENTGTIGNNFMATVRRHPLFELAASMARESLIRRESENTWGKTGPGLITRATAKFLSCGEEERGILIVKHCQIGRFIQMHLPLPYKKKASYWDAKGKNSSRLYTSTIDELARNLSAGRSI
ncbi:hypothetical protein JJJ17_02040 [Paracoccus caeni]|uniref:Uncharacterized protein n=1 Tax=Paracoccus caeni TaxID=657651 RepID=A0A934S981_9RHOB|nr:glycosyltransferase [Paracoccus caeni]MBK4214700.1 hypothetical protein [Paracoccus caeni]